MQQAIVLAGEIDGGRARRGGAEDLVYTPSARPRQCADADDAGGIESQVHDTIHVLWRRPFRRERPKTRCSDASHLSTKGIDAPNGRWQCVALELLRCAAHDLWGRHEDELAPQC